MDPDILRKRCPTQGRTCTKEECNYFRRDYKVCVWKKGLEDYMGSSNLRILEERIEKKKAEITRAYEKNRPRVAEKAEFDLRVLKAKYAREKEKAASTA